VLVPHQFLFSKDSAAGHLTSLCPDPSPLPRAIPSPSGRFLYQLQLLLPIFVVVWLAWRYSSSDEPTRSISSCASPWKLAAAKHTTIGVHYYTPLLQQESPKRWKRRCILEYEMHVYVGHAHDSAGLVCIG
jgi:hypothetical protein